MKENRRAFTIIEMLVVIVIIGILASLAIPSLKGFNESNIMAAATRQLMDDVAYARQKAMNNRTTVYMVFIPPDFWNLPDAPILQTLSDVSDRQLDVPIKGQAAMYALVSFRSLGDQPGQMNFQYLTDWRELPEGVLIETNKFARNNFAAPIETIVDPYDATRQFPIYQLSHTKFMFPPAETTNALPKQFLLPYIAFNSQGKLVSGKDGEDELIPLARGSVFIQTDNDGRPLRGGSKIPLPADIIVTGYREATRTNYNIVRIDRLTGRARLERMELQ